MSEQNKILSRQRVAVLKLQASISQSVGYFIICATSVIYINGMWIDPLKDTIIGSISVIAVIVTLSALCFTLIPCLPNSGDKTVILTAGEKLFHCSLFILQAILLKYACEKIDNYEWLFKHLSLRLYSEKLIRTLSIISILWAVFLFFSAYKQLNRFLWDRYLKSTEPGIN